MASKRSLLDLLPEPKQRDKRVTAKKRKQENRETKSAAEDHADNEQYRVNLRGMDALHVKPDTVPDNSAFVEEAKEMDADMLIMKAMEEEEKSTKGKKQRPEVEFKEISQDDLKSGISSVQREVDAIGLALKADADEDDKVVLPEYTLSKEARTKHQITTLYQTMKKNETKLLTKEAQNAKTKRETERKYGWR